MGMMGIKNIILQLQRIGNIKMGFKGEPRKKKHGKGTYRLPQKLDHFMVTTMERDEKTDDWIVNEEFMEQVGEKPTSLPVFVPYDHIDLIFPREYAWWSGSRRHCQGNGEFALRTENEGDKPVQMKCPCDKLDNECKPRGILNVILEGSGRIGGVHQLRTTSHNTIRNIVSSLSLIKSLTGGPLAGIPLTLTIQPMRVHPKGQKNMITIYVAGLEYRANLTLPESEMEQLVAAAHGQVQARLATGQDMKLLEVAVGELDIDTVMDAVDWEEEFTAPDEADVVDTKTSDKAAGLKKRMTTAQESKEDKAKTGPVSTGKKTVEKSKPTEAEQIAALRVDLNTLLDEVGKTMDPAKFRKWNNWMNRDSTVEHLQAGKDELLKIKSELKKSSSTSKPAKKGRPSLKLLTTQLTSLLDKGHTDGLVTDDEVKNVGGAALKNQNAKWLTDQITEWTEAIKARQSIRDEESESTDPPDSESRQQSIV